MVFIINLKNLRARSNKAHADWIKDKEHLRAKKKLKDARLRFEKNLRLTKAMFSKKKITSFKKNKRQIYGLLNELTAENNESK